MNKQRQAAKPVVVVAGADPDCVTVLGRLVRVLVVDHELITATTGAAVLDHVATRWVPLVITGDEVLGMELLKLRTAITARSPATRVLVISTDATPTLEQGAWATPVDYFLPRPFEIDQLEDIVRMALPDAFTATALPEAREGTLSAIRTTFGHVPLE
jgi:DNA-binding NtrC family response regulator